ncbi:MAG: glucose-6-phosphate dehydrogenase assembly protein OpcA [Nocardioidaceae bacterium]|nr:glucose-6-phosphate dehydrogenase assembly protein OpcA [Nocardioidaceae bacterium]MDQ3326411.1 glucose-6-phosphate dehydrogenase assembly protein OpcA [Actinomycetota bacterium]
MLIDLTDTNASKVSAALLQARLRAGSPTMGMVLTFVVVTDEANHEQAMADARTVSTEHPSRILGVIRGARRGRPRLDAEVSVGQGASGETVLLRLSGELVDHAVSVVTPLLLPDSPVVVWWPTDAPQDPASDPLGQLALRRITDAAAATRSRTEILRRRSRHYRPGDTDLAWTRLTPWRALLAAGLDQHPVRITGATVEATHGNASADLMAAWLRCRLRVDVELRTSDGPGITKVALHSRHGDIALHRPDGRLADFTIPGEADRPVALQRREVAELLAEELRRLDNDDVYQDAVQVLAMSGRGSKRKSAQVPPSESTAPTSVRVAKQTSTRRSSKAPTGKDSTRKATSS